MPSQIGHGLAGACGYILIRQRVSRQHRPWLFIGSILIANLADVDLLFGIFTGDYGRFHGGPTHSLSAVFAVGLVTGLLTSRWSRKGALWGIWAAGVYLSHVLLDLLGGKVQLFWPFSTIYFGSWLPIFGAWNFLQPALDLFSQFVTPTLLSKIGTRLSELLVMTPLVLLAWYAGYRSARRNENRRFKNARL
jgi:inner membrane protein